MAPDAAGLTIITGQGKHSEDSVAVIKPQIEAMLAAPAYAGLAAAVDAANPGRLVVSAENLRAWARATSPSKS